LSPSSTPRAIRLPLPLLLCLCLAIVLFSPSLSSLFPTPLRASAYYVSEEGFMMDGLVEMPALRVTHSITLDQVGQSMSDVRAHPPHGQQRQLPSPIAVRPLQGALRLVTGRQMAAATQPDCP